MDDENSTESGAFPRLLTVNQVVAWNIAWLRNAAGLTQREFGERLGWSNQAVSEAERSFAGQRTRLFNAQELTELALALGVPLSALFLPPDDWAYQFADGAGDARDMDTLMRLALPDSDDETPVMAAYRDRFTAAVNRYFTSDPDWARLVARWISDSPQRRNERADRLRRQRAALLQAADAAAAELEQLANAIESEGGA